MSLKTEQKPNLHGRGSEFVIRVKGGQGAAIRGKVEHIKTGQVQYFDDFLELILLVQSKLDESNYPQSDTELRTLCYQSKG
jgi:hypothetical protein